LSYDVFVMLKWFLFVIVFLGILIPDKIKSSVFMSRFDYNPVPQPFISDFMQQLSSCNFTLPETPVCEKWGYFSAATDSMLDSVIAIMERTIVPKILEYKFVGIFAVGHAGSSR